MWMSEYAGNGHGPQYHAVHCVPLSNQRHLRSAKRNLLRVPHHRLNTYGRPPGFCHCWSARVEQSSGPCPQSELHRSCFQAPPKDSFVCTVLAHRAHNGIFPAMQNTNLRIDTHISTFVTLSSSDCKPTDLVLFTI